MKGKGKILITGASGFIGQGCALALHLAQYNVRLAVRNLNNLSPMEKDLECVLVKELSSDTRWDEALQDCECVIHTAGRAHVLKEMVKNPSLEYRRINVEGTIALAKQAVSAGVKRFIYISSIKVNGETNRPGVPFRADDHPHPKDAYSQSKYEAEVALRSLGVSSGLEIVIIRPPLIYGPGVKGNLRILLRWLQKGLPIPVTHLENKRSFVALSNLVDFIEVCINHPNAVNEIFLVSDGFDLSLIDLLMSIGNSLNKSPHLWFFPTQILFPLLILLGKRSLLDRLYGSLQVDIEKNERLLGWKPKYDVQDMLNETVSDYLSRYGRRAKVNNELIENKD